MKTYTRIAHISVMPVVAGCRSADEEERADHGDGDGDAHHSVRLGVVDKLDERQGPTCGHVVVRRYGHRR